MVTDPTSQSVIEVVIGVLVRRDAIGAAEVLIARRPHDTVLPDYWEMPGGKVEAGESHHAALRREFREELDIEVEPGKPLPAIEHAYDHGRVQLNPYYCSHLAGEPRNIEVVEHRWVQTNELLAIRFPPANASLIEQVVRDLA